MLLSNDGFLRIPVSSDSRDAFEVVFDVNSGVPTLVHIGPTFGTEVAELPAMLERPIPDGSLDSEAPASLCPSAGRGWFGHPGLSGRRTNSHDWSPRFTADETDIGDQASLPTARISSRDKQAELLITTEITCLAHSIRLRLHLENEADSSYAVDDFAMTVALPSRAQELLHLTGRWADEFQQRRIQWPEGELSFENRKGRTSHDRVPAIFAGTSGFTQNTGEVWAATLGWSGNATTSAELLNDGRRTLRLGELLTGGDVILQPSESYMTPWLELTYSNRGLNGISQAFHHSIRDREGYRADKSPRPVTLNTWEAVYFDHDLPTLKQLADKAAHIGVERFVLDDGWFEGRRGERVGLGDWWVDAAVWPDGLNPLITHVKDLGMEFGIWIEPEMVNPESQLFRNHPDWILNTPGYEPALGRYQLVLDCGRTEVRAYLIEKLDALLSDHDISYIKWDCNRDVVDGGHGSVPGLHNHTLGVYELFDQLRRLHPNVEIESCASGGARADFEVLQRTDRIWPSDSNDALVRQHIQQGFSLLFPAEIMGSHIGPPQSHTSGRQHLLSFRAATAFLGHFGIEWNLLKTSPTEVEGLRSIIEEHKKARPTIHGNAQWRLDTADASSTATVVVNDDQTLAYLSYAQLTAPPLGIPAPVRIVGLDPERVYTFSVLDFGHVPTRAKRQPSWYTKGGSAHGRLLETIGLQPPLLFPETAVILKFESADV